MQNGKATLKNNLALSYKVKYAFTTGPRNPLLYVYPRERKIYDHTKNLHTNVYSRSVHANLDWKEPKCPLTGE